MRKIITVLLMFLSFPVAAFELPPDAIHVFETLAAPIEAIEKYRINRSSWPSSFPALMEFANDREHELELDPSQYCDVVLEILPNDQLRLRLSVVPDSSEGCVGELPVIFSIDSDQNVSWVIDTKSQFLESRKTRNEGTLDKRREETLKKINKNLDKHLSAPEPTDGP